VSANWFVGLPIAAGGWLAPLLGRVPPGLRHLHADDLHLTVAFLGPIDEERAHRAFAVVEGEELLGGEARLGGLRALGNPRRPTALSIEIEGSVAHDLVAQLRDPLTVAAGRPLETRAILPHVTIARPARDASTATRCALAGWAETMPPLGVDVVLDRIALFTAAARGERRYREVLTRALG
jgi:2'-5' RNA ligase